MSRIVDEIRECVKDPINNYIGYVCAKKRLTPQQMRNKLPFVEQGDMGCVVNIKNKKVYTYTLVNDNLVWYEVVTPERADVIYLKRKIKQ